MKKFASLLATSVAFLLLFAGCEEAPSQPDHVPDNQVDMSSTEVAVTFTDQVLADDVSAVDDSLQTEDVEDDSEFCLTQEQIDVVYGHVWYCSSWPGNHLLEITEECRLKCDSFASGAGHYEVSLDPILITLYNSLGKRFCHPIEEEE